MRKFKFEKCLSSHGVFLVCRSWCNDLLAAYYPLYREFKLYNDSFPFLEQIMKAHHFDHQFDEIQRFREMVEFNHNKKH